MPGVQTTPAQDTSPDLDYQQKDQRYFQHARPEMLEFIPTSAQRILDVGCGIGSFGSLVKSHGTDREVWGIELHQESAEQAQSVLENVVVGGVPDALSEVPDEYFDCIVFNDVLEHIVDPEEVLTVVKSKLCKDGCVVASIPNIREFQTLCKFLFQKSWEYTDSGILDRTHVRFFTQPSIRNMFERVGYDLELMQGINYNWRRWPRVLDRLTFGLIRDTMFLQFGCRARPKR